MKIKILRRLIGSVVYPIASFIKYWREFDGAYSGMDLLWGAVVTVVLAVAIFLYFPVAKKIEHFSLAWFLGLLIAVNLVVGGWIMAGAYYLPVAFRAWGEYMLFFGLWMPMIHVILHNIGKPRKKGSFFKRIRLVEDGENANG